jgi:hypothetical protein
MSIESVMKKLKSFEGVFDEKFKKGDDDEETKNLSPD